jgi:hypothetical protein
MLVYYTQGCYEKLCLVTVKGVGGKQLVVSHTGYLDEFFRVHASEEAKPNMLSLAEVEDMYAVTYVPG